LRFSAQTSPLRKSTLAAKDEFHALCVIPAGSERQTSKAQSLDVLHVACARELRLRYFLTFDERQQQLAAAAGLKVARL